jgi:hypothetical protein
VLLGALTALAVDFVNIFFLGLSACRRQTESKPRSLMISDSDPGTLYDCQYIANQSLLCKTRFPGARRPLQGMISSAGEAMSRTIIKIARDTRKRCGDDIMDVPERKHERQEK